MGRSTHWRGISFLGGSRSRCTPRFVREGGERPSPQRARFGVGTRRTVILIAAIVSAAIAAVAIYSYLNTVQDRAYHNAKLVDVYRVDKDAKKGLPGEQAIDGGFVKKGQVPQKYRPTTAVTDINTIRGKL